MKLAEIEMFYKKNVEKMYPMQDLILLIILFLNIDLYLNHVLKYASLSIL